MLSSKHKYLKYKTKYTLLKESIFGDKHNFLYNIKNLAIDDGLMKIVDTPESPTCSIKKDLPLLETNGILDLDCLRLSIEPESVISKDCLDMIREEIQPFYDDFFNYLCFPNRYGEGTGFDYNSTNTRIVRKKTVLEYTIPIINMPGRQYLGTTDYDYFIARLVEHNDFINLCGKYDTYAEIIIDWLKHVNKIFSLNFDNIKLLDLHKICRKLIDTFKNDIDKTICEKIELHIKNLDDVEPNDTGYFLGNLGIMLFNEVYVNLQNKRKINVSREDSKIFSTLLNQLLTIGFKSIQQSNGLVETIFGLNTLYSIDKLRTKIYNKKEKVKQLTDIIEFKREYLVEKVLDIFQKEQTNKMVVSLGLIFFSDFNTFKSDGHSNSLVIYKYADNTHLVIRTEPHRHTNIYCRPSLRKTIRGIFKNNKSFAYKDYVIESKYRVGLQVFEEKQTDLDLKNETDFDKLPRKYQIKSPLQGNSGFCASWTMYTTFILLLNQDKNLKEIGVYLGSYGLNTGDKDQYDTLYTLYKQIKLYRLILFNVCFIYRTMGAYKFDTIFLNSLKSRGISITKINHLEKTIKSFSSQFNKFDERLKKLSITPMIRPDMSNFDPHYCNDSLFDHTEMCQPDNKTKTITDQQKKDYNCNSTSITLTGVNQAKINERNYINQVYTSLTKGSDSPQEMKSDNTWVEKSSIAENISRLDKSEKKEPITKSIEKPSKAPITKSSETPTKPSIGKSTKSSETPSKAQITKSNKKRSSRSNRYSKLKSKPKSVSATTSTDHLESLPAASMEESDML
jgi:hypothetical protein